MNQILITKDYNSIDYNYINKDSYISKQQYFLRYQLIISILFIYSFSLYFSNSFYSMKNDEIKSQQLLDNYNINRLYSSVPTQESASAITVKTDSLIIGIIEIKKLGIVYPILSNSTDKLLKVSPCRFYGPLPNEYGNLCIAGHNYDDNRFFSKINTLKDNDVISIYDDTGNCLEYKVYSIYETSNNDTECTTQIDSVKEITLVTCNNINGNRIIVKAKT